MLFPYHDDNPTRSFPILTIALIAANLLIYAWQASLPPAREMQAVVTHGFTPNRLTHLWKGEPGKVQLGEDHEVDFPPNPQAIYLTILSSMFMHGSWMHVLGNMWFLWLFGNNIEDVLGKVRFILFYLLGGVSAVAAQWLINPESPVPMIGASGAVSAVLGAYAVLYPRARVHTMLFLGLVLFIELPALAVLGMWFVLQALEGVNALGREGAGSGVAFWAHIGGFVEGALLIYLFRIGRPPLEKGGVDRYRPPQRYVRQRSRGPYGDGY